MGRPGGAPSGGGGNSGNNNTQYAVGAGGGPPAAPGEGGVVLSPRAAAAQATDTSGVGVKMAELLLGSSPTSKDIDRGMANLSLRVSPMLSFYLLGSFFLFIFLFFFIFLSLFLSLRVSWSNTNKKYFFLYYLY